MPFADLETMSMKEYIAQEAAKDSFWFFMHIPKTAGTSFSNELASRMTPYRNIHADYTRTDMGSYPQMTIKCNEFMAELAQRHFSSASGHATWNQFEALRSMRPDTRFITFLRDPMTRVISDYRYQRTPMHPPYKEFIEKFPKLESYVQHKIDQDKMATFFGGLNHKMSGDELVARVRQDFTFVGLLEMYPLSFSSIFACMGHPGLKPGEHQRKTPDTEETKVTITPEIKALIRECNPLDFKIYDYVRGVLLRHRDAQRAANQARLAKRAAKAPNNIKT